jgi:tetratricopeptide (TPR) repeat protein
MATGALASCVRDPRVTWALLALGLLALFARTAGFDFVWDDLPNVVDNPYFEASLGEGIRATQHDHLDHTLLGAARHPVAYESYRPLLWLSYRLDDVLWGRTSWAMHLHGLAWAALLAALALAVTRRLLPTPAAAAAATAVFLFHPIQVETIAYVSARGDLLCTVFALASSWAFLVALDPATTRGRHVAASLGVGLAFVVSLSAKEASAGLPVALLGLALAQRRLRAAWLPLGCAFAGLAGYVVARLWLIGRALSSVDAGEGLAAIVGGPGVLLAYAGQILVPARLSIERLPPDGAAWLVSGWIAALGFAGLAVAALVGERASPRSRIAWAGVVWFAALLAPSLLAVQTMGVLADRYVSTALLGAAIAATAGFGILRDALPERRRGFLPIGAGAWAALCVGVAVLQVGTWRDNGALYDHALRAEPRSSMANFRVGVLAARDGDWPRAGTAFERAIRLDPGNVFALNNLGVAHLKVGNLEQAERFIREALSLSGDRNFRAWNNLALVHFARDEREPGCQALLRSQEINPAYARAAENHASWCAHAAASGAPSRG